MDDPIYVNDKDNIMKVIKKLLQTKKGYVLVKNIDDEAIGIISDRDIHRLLLKEGGMFSPDLIARDFMVKPVIKITRNKTLQQAEDIMRENKINRLPVVEEKGSKHVIGIVNFDTIHKNLVTSFARSWVNKIKK